MDHSFVMPQHPRVPPVMMLMFVVNDNLLDLLLLLKIIEIESVQIKGREDRQNHGVFWTQL